MRAVLRPHNVGALRDDTAGAELERRRLADRLALGSTPGVLPPAAQGESLVSKHAKTAAGLASMANTTEHAGNTITMPPGVMNMPSRLDMNHLAETLLPIVPGFERVMLFETLDERARYLACSPYEQARHVLSGTLDCCSFACWSAARPRAYVRINENSFEMNRVAITCPSNACMHDSTTKVFFDKTLHVTPFRVRHCSPYHCCWTCEPCGHVVAFAPCACAANEATLTFCPCLFTLLPGLQDGDAFVAFYIAARDEFKRRTSGHRARQGCGCFHAQRAARNAGAE